MQKKIIIIAGPNRAGKTTFARSFLPEENGGARFLNADLIAAGLSPFSPESMAVKAGRIMLSEMDACVARDESFAFETTLSGRTYLRSIESWKLQGYQVHLHFLKLASVDIAVSRVRERVKQGGHNIPETVIRRRFESGYANFENFYRNAVNWWACYENSGDKPILINWGTSNAT